MIPAFNQSGVLPPFHPQLLPTDPGAMAPYRALLVEVVARFGNTPERKAILSGLLDFRAEMRQAGIVDGFQWIDGSFLEDCEGIRSRPPEDIDIVTFARRPVNYSNRADWNDFFNANRHLFDQKQLKAKYKCDAYYVDLEIPGSALVSNARYWFGVFSHQRATFLWKGLVEIPLSDDDATARSLIAGSVNAS